MTVICFVQEGDSVTFAAASYAYRGLGADNLVRDPREANRMFITSPFVSAPDSIIATNFAVPGNRLDPHLLARESTVLGLVPTSPLTGGNRQTRKWILSLLIGTNQHTSDPNQHADDVEAYLTRILAKFDAVILGTIPSRMDGGNTTFDTTYAQPCNAIYKNSGYMTSYKNAGRLFIWDGAGDARIGGTGAAADDTYFSDDVHPNEAGQIIMADSYEPVVAEAIAAVL